MFLDQLTDFMILVLIAAAVISGAIGEFKDSIAIIVIILLNAVIGFVQEYRAERAVAALRRMSEPVARVRRGGRLLQVASREGLTQLDPQKAGVRQRGVLAFRLLQNQ